MTKTSQQPERPASDTARDYENSDPGALTLDHPMIEPSIYGDVFQNVAIRRSTTVSVPPRPQDIDRNAYESRPKQ